MSRLSNWLRKIGLKAPRYVPPDGVTIGRHTYGVVDETIIFASKEAAVSIGSFCSVAGGVLIFGESSHPTDCATTFPIHQKLLRQPWPPMKEGTRAGVTIGNDVWLCLGSTIMPGVRVGNGAIVASRAVVTKDVPPYAVVAGVPAKVVRYRFTDDIIAKLLQIRWWEWDDDKIRHEAGSLTGPIEAFVARHLMPTRSDAS